MQPSESPPQQPHRQQGLRIPEEEREGRRQVGSLWRWISLRELVFIFVACSVGAALFRTRDNVRLETLASSIPSSLPSLPLSAQTGLGFCHFNLYIIHVYISSPMNIPLYSFEEAWTRKMDTSYYRNGKFPMDDERLLVPWSNPACIVYRYILCYLVQRAVTIAR